MESVNSTFKEFTEHDLLAFGGFLIEALNLDIDEKVAFRILNEYINFKHNRKSVEKLFNKLNEIEENEKILDARNLEELLLRNWHQHKHSPGDRYLLEKKLRQYADYDLVRDTWIFRKEYKT